MPQTPDLSTADIATIHFLAQHMASDEFNFNTESTNILRALSQLPETPITLTWLCSVGTYNFSTSSSRVTSLVWYQWGEGNTHFILTHPRYAEQYWLLGGDFQMPTLLGGSETLGDIYPQYLRDIPSDLWGYRPEYAIMLCNPRPEWPEDEVEELRVEHLLLSRVDVTEESAGVVLRRVTAILDLCRDDEARKYIMEALSDYVTDSLLPAIHKGVTVHLLGYLRLFPRVAPYLHLVEKWGVSALISLYPTSLLRYTYGLPEDAQLEPSEIAKLVDATLGLPDYLRQRTIATNIERITSYIRTSGGKLEVTPELLEMLKFPPYDLVVFNWGVEGRDDIQVVRRDTTLNVTEEAQEEIYNLSLSEVVGELGEIVEIDEHMRRMVGDLDRIQLL